MNFPMDNPLLQFFYWLINTAGVGGLAVLLIAGGSLAVYLFALGWVARGAEPDEEVYTFPTPTLLGHEKSD
jgi:hypothetical protein